jgi:tol-pal system protein YbgF
MGIRRRCHATASRPAALLAVLLLAATACASGEAERTRRAAEVAGLRSELATLRESQETQAREIARLGAQLKAVDAQQAFLVAEAKASKGELARLQGALDSARPVATTPPTPDAGARALPPPASREIAADQVFSAAMATLRAEEYGPAAVEFGELVRRFPEHALAPTAQYWIGEARYRQRDYHEALAEFSKVVTAYPRSSQVPEALLKVGLCYRALKDMARARESWELLTKEHPTTSAGMEARSLLAQLQGASGHPR